MAFKRSAVRSRLAPPIPKPAYKAGFFHVLIFVLTDKGNFHIMFPEKIIIYKYYEVKFGNMFGCQ